MSAAESGAGSGGEKAGEGEAGGGANLPALLAPAETGGGRGALASLAGEDFSRYLAQVHRFPMLEADEERLLVQHWREKRDKRAAERLVTSHLRLVARMALGYRGYGLPLSDMVSEGTLGLLRAVERFDPGRKVRLSTYASWWIRAAMQDYILRSWSLVRIGSSAEKKRLFFRLREVRNRLMQYDRALLEGPGRHAKMAELLDASENDVREMEQRLDERDLSLQAPLGGMEGGEEGGATWLERLPVAGPSPEAAAEAREEGELRRRLLEEALDSLPERERAILAARRLAARPQTLEALAGRFGVSGERVRQLEQRAFSQLKERLLQLAAREGLLP